MTDTLFPIAATPLLLDVPRNRTKLEVWKERHGVRTHESPGHPLPWIALLPFEDDEGKSTTRIIAESHRLYVETHQTEFGTTEEEACHALAVAQELPFYESISQADCAAPSPARKHTSLP